MNRKISCEVISETDHGYAECVRVKSNDVRFAAGQMCRTRGSLCYKISAVIDSCVRQDYYDTKSGSPQRQT